MVVSWVFILGVLVLMKIVEKVCKVVVVLGYCFNIFVWVIVLGESWIIGLVVVYLEN